MGRLERQRRPKQQISSELKLKNCTSELQSRAWQLHCDAQIRFEVILDA